MSRKALALPAPHYVVFYSGAEQQPEYQELRLSDLYGGHKGAVEVVATVLNVNKGFSESLKEACTALADYAELISRIRLGSETMPIEDAVEEAVSSCIRDGVMARYLRAHRAEVNELFLTDYDEELARKLMRQEAFEDGFEDGRAEERNQMVAAIREAGIPEDEISRIVEASKKAVASASESPQGE